MIKPTKYINITCHECGKIHTFFRAWLEGLLKKETRLMCDGVKCGAEIFYQRILKIKLGGNCGKG